MVRLHATIADRRLAIRMVLQVHDELLLEVTEGDLETAQKTVRRDMEEVAALLVPLRVDLKSGPNWAELERL